MLCEYFAKTIRTVHTPRSRIAAGMVLGIALLSGCRPSLAPPAFQALTDTVPPCWHAICPGETTIQNTVEILKSLPGIGSIETFLPAEGKPVTPHTTWFPAPTPTKENVSGSCYYRDDSVFYCEMGTAGLKLSHVIEHYGDPEAVAFVEEWGDGRMLAYWVLYPQRGLIAVGNDLNWRSGEAIELKPTMRIDGYYILHPDSYEEIFSHYDYTGPYDNIEQTRRPWSGYGTYEYEVP